jgi:CubicO group peptidase (beta-lactamase class C family)
MPRRRNLFAQTFLLAIILPVLALQLVAQTPSTVARLKEIDAYSAQAGVDWKVPGFAIAIVKDDQVVFAKGYGVLELGKTPAVDENTLFAIASNSKAFTAAALAILVDEGKVKWDDKVTKYLPSFELYDPYVTHELTIRDLLSHRSGLATFGGDLLWYESEYSRDEILRRIRFLKPTSSFRSRFGYQNVLFLAAGEVVAKVTGKSWDEFVRERFFGPLGMKRTVTSHADLLNSSNVAIPHNEVDGKNRAIRYGKVANKVFDLFLGVPAATGTRRFSRARKTARQPERWRIEKSSCRRFPKPNCLFRYRPTPVFTQGRCLATPK